MKTCECGMIRGDERVEGFGQPRDNTNGQASGSYHENGAAHTLAGERGMQMRVPFSSSFREFRLNCLHHEARSRLDGGDEAPTGSGDVGKWTGSMPGCDFPVTMAKPSGRRVGEGCERRAGSRRPRVIDARVGGESGTVDGGSGTSPPVRKGWG